MVFMSPQKAAVVTLCGAVSAVDFGAWSVSSRSSTAMPLSWSGLLMLLLISFVYLVSVNGVMAYHILQSDNLCDMLFQSQSEIAMNNLQYNLSEVQIYGCFFFIFIFILFFILLKQYLSFHNLYVVQINSKYKDSW